jgi:hypothetical protein
VTYPVVKMLEVGDRRTGDIQAARISQNQQVQQDVTVHNVRPFEVYKAKWQQEKEERWAEQLEGEQQESRPSERCAQ